MEQFEDEACREIQDETIKELDKTLAEQKKMGEAEELLALWKKRPSPKAHTHFYFKHEYIKWIANFEPKFEAFLKNVDMAIQSKNLAYEIMEKAYVKLAKKQEELRNFREELQKYIDFIDKARTHSPSVEMKVKYEVYKEILKRLDGLKLGKEVNK